MEKTLKHQKFETFLSQNVSADTVPILLQFPKEFRRNWLRQFDQRFIIILISTFILEVCTLLLLISWVRGKEKSVDVNSLQKQYAKLLIDKFVDNNFDLDDSKPKDTYLFGVTEESDQITSSSEYQAHYGQQTESDYSTGYSSSSEGTGFSTSKSSESYVGQTSFPKPSNSYRSVSAERVSSLGLLHYLSGDEKKNASDEELKEIFAQGDRNVQYLEGSIANINIKNFKKQGGSTESRAEGSSESSFAGLKGTKSQVTRDEARSSLTPLEKVNYSTIAKNTELEEVSSSVLNKTGKKASARNADQVTRVVLSHNRAIQDCYKQALKKQSDLKGKIVVRFSVKPDGSVDLVEIIQTTISYDPMLRCVINRIRRWNDFGEGDPTLGTVSYRQTYVFGY